ncbi:MAG: N-acetylmuramoyl-L-alanine amidase [Coriobacteriia bacterium]|nr:N-acetylmuramoyl-L-alanine amidase [Coriobacteriia bacterium]
MARHRRPTKKHRKHVTHKQVALKAVAALVVCLVGIGCLLVGLNASRRAADSHKDGEPASGVTATAGQLVEVPDVVGSTIKEAMAILNAAGLAPLSPPGASSEEPARIVSQEPVAGELVRARTRVVLQVSGSAEASASALASSTISAIGADEDSADALGGRRGLVVCIDPGHQKRSNQKLEPIGPGSAETKISVSGGTTGRATGLPECEVALQIATNLKTRLEKEGVRVVMTRATNDVNISNAARAEVANAAGADLFVRIHCDGNTDSSIAGISTLYPGGNGWVSPISAESKKAAVLIQHSAVVSTGAIDRGLSERSDQTGFNWARVPAVLIECGFMSNEVEDRLLASPHYQDKLAEGIKCGILEYAEAAR